MKRLFFSEFHTFENQISISFIELITRFKLYIIKDNIEESKEDFALYDIKYINNSPKSAKNYLKKLFKSDTESFYSKGGELFTNKDDIDIRELKIKKFFRKKIKKDLKKIIKENDLYIERKPTITNKGYHSLEEHVFYSNLRELKNEINITFGVSVKKYELEDCDFRELVDLIISKLENTKHVIVGYDPISTLFCMTAKLCSIKENIINEQLLFLQNLALNVFEINENLYANIMTKWEKAKEDNNSFEFYVNNFYKLSNADQNLAISTLQIIFGFVAIDEKLDYSKEEMLNYYSNKFALDTYCRELKEIYFPNTDKYYDTLGCNRTDTLEIIKEKYKILKDEIQPNKFASKGLSNLIIEYADKRLKEINEAFHIIKLERNENNKI